MPGSAQEVTVHEPPVATPPLTWGGLSERGVTGVAFNSEHLTLTPTLTWAVDEVGEGQSTTSSVHTAEQPS